MDFVILRAAGANESAAADGFRKHLLDFDRDPVAIDQDDAGGDGKRVGKDFDLVRLGGVEFDNRAAAKPHDLMNGHGGGPENHHEIHGNVIDCCHYYT